MDDSTTSAKDTPEQPGQPDLPEQPDAPDLPELPEPPAPYAGRTRYRTEKRTRQVDFTMFGRTVTYPETYTVRVPIPPRDWARIHQVTVDYVVAAWAWALGYAFVWLVAGAFGVFEPGGVPIWVPFACATVAGLHTGWAGYRLRTRARRRK